MHPPSLSISHDVSTHGDPIIYYRHIRHRNRYLHYQIFLFNGVEHDDLTIDYNGEEIFSDAANKTGEQYMVDPDPEPYRRAIPVVPAVRSDSGHVIRLLPTPPVAASLRTTIAEHYALRRFDVVDSSLHYILPLCQQIQLNSHGEILPPNAADNIKRTFARLRYDGQRIIFQMDGVNDQLFHDCADFLDCDALFDQSHGAGVLPEKWPYNFPACQCGYAGGLGPENLAEQLASIATVADDRWPWWIDMETGVRTGGWFDLAKVRQCCEIVKEFLDA